MSETVAQTRIAFIGGGNMAASLIGGMLEAGMPAQNILVAEPDAERRDFLQQRFQISTTENNADTLTCQCVVLATKPQVMRTVCLALQGEMPATAPLFISIAAGIPVNSLQDWLRCSNNETLIPIIRCMPNTPALIQCGATGLYANQNVSDQQKNLAEQVLSSVGISLWLDTEDQLNAVTAISGSGPAYFFLFMEAMQDAGEALGLSVETSRQLVQQTALGAARMATETGTPAATLRNQVTSKGGTTAAALARFETHQLKQTVMDACQAAHDRSVSLAKELGKQSNPLSSR